MNRRVRILLTILAVALFALLASEDGREGTDDGAQNAVQVLQPGYRQWAKPIWKPATDRGESVMFAIQATAGAGALAWALMAVRKIARARKNG